MRDMPEWRNPGDRFHEPPDWWLDQIVQRAQTTKPWVLRHLIAVLVVVIRLQRDSGRVTADSDSMVEASVECPACGTSIRATTVRGSE